MGRIQRAKAQGATVHLGGEKYGTQGYWVKPTIITNTRSDMEIVKEEMFGPVAIIIRFEDENEVLKLANDSPYGLAASFFTKDLTRSVEVAKKLQAGTVWVNCVNELSPGVPYGGFKQSGVGRECGQYALDTCIVHTFLITHETCQDTNPWPLSVTPTSNPSMSTQVEMISQLPRPEGAHLDISLVEKKNRRVQEL